MSDHPPECSIERATPDHLEEITHLVQDAGLPYDDCADQLEHFIVSTENEKVIACACTEPYGQFGLLRSVVVDDACRGQGIARALFNHLKRRAEQRGVTTLYLLTENAERYFEQLGFQQIDRQMAPSEIQATQQFSSLCPQSAILMELRVN
jgi:amino-acid N-acetyltransferase